MDFEEVPLDELKKYMNKMRDDLPNSVHAYGFICTLLDWREKQTELELGILAPNGEPNLGLLFFIILNNVYLGSLYAQDDEAVKSLEETLLVTKKIPYREKEIFHFTNLNELASKAVRRLTQTIEWQLESNVAEKNKTFWLPCHKAKEVQVNIPEGVEIRELTIDHVKHVNEHWPYKFKGSEDLIKTILELNFGLGVFRGKTLLSWAVIFYYGGIAAVKTLPEERGKGYGQTVISAITKRLGEMERDVHLIVIDGNEKGERFFKALGFQYAFSSLWIIRRFFEEK